MFSANNKIRQSLYILAMICGAFLLTMLIGMDQSISAIGPSTPISQMDCPTVITGGQLPPLSEQLLYVERQEADDHGESYQIVSTMTGFNPIEDSYAAISLDGAWIAWLESGARDQARGGYQYSGYIRATNSNTTRSFPLPFWDRRIDIFWLDNHRLLTAAWRPRAKLMPYSIFDLTTGETRYVHDFPARLGFPTAEKSLLPAYWEGITNFRLSPNGQYAIYHGPGIPWTLYDTANHVALLAEANDIPLSLDWPWSPDSTQFVFYSDGTDSNYEEGFYVYDILEESSNLLAALNTEERTYVYLEDGSWSSDGSYLAFRVDSYNQPEDVYLLHVPTGEIIDLCWGDDADRTESFGFTWSSDNRYLAFSTIQDGVTEHNIYILDVETMNVYEVYKSASNLIGWATLETEEKK